MPHLNGDPLVYGVNGTYETNGIAELESSGSGHLESNGIPPAELHSNPDYIKKITIPLNDTIAFKPRKKLRVVTIGAGYSGMTLAQKLQHKYAEEMDKIVDHVIYEGRDDSGGTWDANTYPGVMCDVPSAIYAFPFDPNPDWSHFYSRGPEILEYFQKTVKKWNLTRNVHFGHWVRGAYWQEDKAQWKLIIEHNGEAREEYADIFISARGFLSTWHWPAIEGLHTFKGHKVHSAGWDHSYDYSNKRIGIIGNGSSGIQILPEMGKLPGTQVTSFQRGPTWVFSRHTPAKLVGSDDPSFNPEYRDVDKERFRDPAELKRYRKLVQGNINAAFKLASASRSSGARCWIFADKYSSSSGAQTSTKPPRNSLVSRWPPNSTMTRSSARS